MLADVMEPPWGRVRIFIMDSTVASATMTALSVSIRVLDAGFGILFRPLFFCDRTKKRRKSRANDSFGDVRQLCCRFTPFAPYAGMTRIRFKGLKLALLSAFRHPCFWQSVVLPLIYPYPIIVILSLFVKGYGVFFNSFSVVPIDIAGDSYLYRYHHKNL